MSDRNVRRNCWTCKHHYIPRRRRQLPRLGAEVKPEPQPALFAPPPDAPRLATPRSLPRDVARDRVRCEWLDVRRPKSDRLTLEWCTADAVESDPVVAFIGINPSAAGDDCGDATCCNAWGIARRGGFKRYLMLNLFSAPATEPIDLLKYPGRPGYGVEVGFQARRVRDSGGRIVIAWGALSGPKELRALLIPRRDQVLGLLDGIPLWCIGTTEDGSPRHPSRMSGNNVRMIPWSTT